MMVDRSGLEPSAKSDTHERMRAGPATRLVLAILGALGFVGLLASSAYVPAYADLLRVAALAWLLAFGVLRFAWIGRR